MTYGNKELTMATNLSIGLDLGSDTIKIAFAYKRASKIIYGKFDGQSPLSQIALPAIAYYNEQTCEWAFCDQVGKGEQASFLTVVKIKSLISLLASTSDPYVTNVNRHYYKKGEHFPKFFFPARKKMLENFDEMVKSDKTFKVEGCTPQSVCKQFFVYVEKIVEERIVQLERQTGLSFAPYKLAIVHPTSVGEDYLAELSSLLEGAFGKKPHKILSSNKALAIFAEHRKVIKDGDNFLVFDMAEEDISVARIGLEKGSIIIDGKDGHNDPCNIGGNDVDEAIVQHLEGCIVNRETIGASSGQTAETAVYSKQYLLMQNIKKAKVIFSKPLPSSSRFQAGVPITLSRDLLIQRKLTKEDVKKSIGVTGNDGIAKRILDYVLSEINRPLNYNVKKIFISGGLTETYSLLDYLKERVKKEKPSIQVLTFDDNKNDEDNFCIRSFEDSVFAAAVGGAITSLTNKEIKVVLSLSYATWGNSRNVNGEKSLEIFAERGSELVDKLNDFTQTFTLRGEGVKNGEAIFSTFITKQDIKNRTFPCKYLGSGDTLELIVGDENSPARKLCQKHIDLKTVSGGVSGYTLPLYKTRLVSFPVGSGLKFVEGMRVDKDGRAHPIVENVEPSQSKVTIYFNGVRTVVWARDISISTNLTDFTTSQG